MQSPETTPLRCIGDKQREKWQTQSYSDGKRSNMFCQQSDALNKIRKYHSNEFTNFPSSASSHKDQSVQNENNQKIKTKQELEVIEEQQSVVSSSLPIRERVGHLLLPYMAANYTIQQRKLIQIQIKLDEILDFLRLQRQKVKGQLFSTLKKSLLLNYQVSLQMQNLRQILFLKPDFYVCIEKKDDKKTDILIALPEEAELEYRKQQFRMRLFEYLSKKDAFSTENTKVKIPLYDFSFMKEQDRRDLKQDIKKKQSFITKLKKYPNQGKINPMDAFRNNNFQDILLQKIKENEMKLKQQKQKQEKIIELSALQVQFVFDQIPKIYRNREKSSMFKSSVFQDLEKKLNQKKQVIAVIFNLLLNRYPQFFKVIEHKSGEILQIQIKLYNEVRKKIQQDLQSKFSYDFKEDRIIETKDERSWIAPKSPKKAVMDTSNKTLHKSPGKQKTRIQQSPSREKAKMQPKSPSKDKIKIKDQNENENENKKETKRDQQKNKRKRAQKINYQPN